MSLRELKCFIVLMLGVFLSACEKPKNESPKERIVELEIHAPALDINEEMRLKRLVADYWRNVRKLAEKSQHDVSTLQEDIGEFLLDPTIASHTEAKEAWLRAYLSFQALAVPAAFAKVAPNTFSEQSNIWLAIDPFPIAAGFIDDIGPYKNIGLVNEQSFELSEESVRSQHALTHESEAVLGFLPMAFLLWGDLTGDQDRLKKFEPASEQSSVTRRRQLLEINSRALKNDMAVLQQWLDDTGPIDVSFYRLPVLAQIELVRESTALNIEQRILSVLADPQVENWRPEDVWLEVLKGQLKQIIVQLDFLEAVGIQVNLETKIVDGFINSIEGQELSADKDRAALFNLLKLELKAVHSSLSAIK